MSQQYNPQETYAQSSEETMPRSTGAGGGSEYQGQAMQQSTQIGGQSPQTGGQPMQTGGQPMQMGGQSMQMGGQMSAGGQDMTLEDALTDEMRVALHDFVQSATACEWCADCCIDEGPEMAECIRLCRDVADLATLNVQFIARDSVFGPEAAELFASAADACARECAQHHHRHCQECAETLSRAANSTRKMLASFGNTTGMKGPQGSEFQRSIGGQF